MACGGTRASAKCPHAGTRSEAPDPSPRWVSGETAQNHTKSFHVRYLQLAFARPHLGQPTHQNANLMNVHYKPNAPGRHSTSKQSPPTPLPSGSYAICHVVDTQDVQQTFPTSRRTENTWQKQRKSGNLALSLWSTSPAASRLFRLYV